VAQQQQRRLGRPVGVVDHEQHRRPLGDGRHQLDHGLEEPVALRLGIGADRGVQATHQVAEVGHQPGQLAGQGAEHPPQLGGPGRVDVPAQRLGDRLVGHGQLLVATAPQHDAALLVGEAGQLLDQAGLADAGLTGDQHDPPLPADRLLPGVHQRVPLRDPAGEREHVGQLDGRWQRDADRVRAFVVGCRPDDLAHRQRARDALELQLTDRSQLVVGPRPGEHPDHVGGQDLAALGRRAEPGRLHHRRAEPVVVFEGGLAGAEPHPHLQRPSVEPALAGHGLLHGHRALDRVGGAAVAGHHRITDRLDLGPAGGRDGRAQELEVGAPHLVGGVVAELLAKLGRSDQIGEQDAHQSRCRHPHPPGDHGSRVGAGYREATAPTWRRAGTPVPLTAGPQ
jgi:hypothetical protein